MSYKEMLIWTTIIEKMGNILGEGESKSQTNEKVSEVETF